MPPRPDDPPARPSHDGGASARARAKILSLDQLLERRRDARQRGLRVAQCHGCFDIVHPGHIRHLRQARAHADILLVSITGDVGYAKHGGAPLINEDLRAENLAELDCVDWVYIEPRPTASELLELVRPDVYIKGREYESNSDPRFAAERRAVERHGGKVVFSSGDVVFSSTALIGALERSVDPYHARLTRLLERPELGGPVLNGYLARFRGRRVLVIGETILDTYIFCDQPEVAAESPVLTLRPLERRTYDGGAAVIARHVAAMGGHPVLLTGLPARSPHAAALLERLDREGIEVRAIQTSTPLAEKQRFLVGTQKVMKLNVLEPMDMDASRRAALLTLAEDIANTGALDAAIVADFGNGLLSPGLTRELCLALRPRVRTLAGDVSGRRASLTAFHSADLLCPSEAEARAALHNYEESLPAVAWRLLSSAAARHAIITMGADGLVAFDRLDHQAPPAPEGRAPDAPGDDNRSRVRGEHVPAFSVHPVDPLGCGDALIAAATLSLAVGAPLIAAAFLGSVAAACQAQRLGNTPISSSDLRHGIVRLHTGRLAAAQASEPASIGVARPVPVHA
jgi:rfaE bifunctional protein nucleotidyltransferase chain/domain